MRPLRLQTHLGIPRLRSRAVRAWNAIPDSPLWTALTWAAGLTVGLLAMRWSLDLTPLGMALAWTAVLGAALAFVSRARPVLKTPEARPEAPAPEEEPEQEAGPPGPPPLLDMIRLPGGIFSMGSPPATEEEIAGFVKDDVEALGGDPKEREENLRRWLKAEQPAHRVRLSPFDMARDPVTRARWRELMPTAPEEWEKDGSDGELPATHLDWYQALAFCNALSEREGLDPCYARDEQGQWRWVADTGYRLPTEAEREYACRAGTQTRWFWGDDPAGADTHTWYRGNAGGQLQPVGAAEHANRWRLRDMAGLVLEWCWDRYGPYAPNEGDPPLDPRGAQEGDRRAIRGGSFVDPPVRLRSADRAVGRPDDRGDFLGLRCVRSHVRQ